MVNYPHQIGISEDQWQQLQRLSGNANPAGYVRNLVNKHIIEQLEGQHLGQSKVSGVTSHLGFGSAMESPFEDRWKAIGCALRKFDDFYQARGWYVSQFSSEEAALFEIEERHRYDGLHSPRRWIWSQYVKQRRAG